MLQVNGKVYWDKLSLQVDRLNFEKRIQKYINSKSDILSMNKLILQKRIGSASCNSEVYKGIIKNKNTDFVVKILPIIEEDSKIKCKKERSIHRKLSKLVFEGKSIRFPIIYATYLCFDTIFYSDILTHKSLVHQKGICESELHFIETASCDVKQYLDRNSYITQKEIDYIHSECIDAIRNLHLSGIAHCDIDLTNFLVLPYENEFGYIILINDFGSAVYDEKLMYIDFDTFEYCFSNYFQR